MHTTNSRVSAAPSIVAMKTKSPIIPYSRDEEQLLESSPPRGHGVAVGLTSREGSMLVDSSLEGHFAAQEVNSPSFKPAGDNSVLKIPLFEEI